MSGGFFDYQQYGISEIADKVERLLSHKYKEDEYNHIEGLSEETLSEFRTGVEALRKAYIYAQRIDWLLSGDDGEESFHQRLKEDLAK